MLKKLLVLLHLLLGALSLGAVVVMLVLVSHGAPGHDLACGPHRRCELPSGRYADLGRCVVGEMVRDQRVDLDGVSGATTTSRALQKATRAALASAARRDPRPRGE